MSATSGIDSPISNNLLMASWRRSWKRRSLRPARLLKRTHANLKALELTGKGCVSVLGRCCWRIEIALEESGTSLLLPFLVSGRKAVRRFRSILSQDNPSISPRLIPVSMAKTTIGQMWGFWVSLETASNLSYWHVLFDCVVYLMIPSCC